ncbi:MAG: AAA family ATPase, partial [Patescibacteria group bacterium]|nr:AAA family ATPase [Patescibacteria group bacterium]
MTSTDLTAKADVSTTKLLGLFELTSMQQLIDIGDIEMLTNIIPKGMLTLMYAGGGVGKSTIVASQIKEALSKSEDLEVLLLDFDQALVRNRNTLMELVDLPRFGNTSISNQDHAENIIETIKALPSLENTVIVVDALQGMFDRFNRDINKAVDAGFIMDILKLYRDKGATVIIVHHSNKIDKDGFATFRGSAVIKDSVDNLYEVKGVDRDSEYLTLKVCMEDHKYSFLIDDPNPIYKIDRKLSYTVVEPSKETEKEKLPKGVTGEHILECLNI